LQPTTQRLGEAAASTNISAAHGFSISHVKFMRVTAAVAPNRKLGAGIISFFRYNPINFVNVKFLSIILFSKNYLPYFIA
jgi:hypothetical protein